MLRSIRKVTYTWDNSNQDGHLCLTRSDFDFTTLAALGCSMLKLSAFSLMHMLAINYDEETPNVTQVI